MVRKSVVHTFLSFLPTQSYLYSHLAFALRNPPLSTMTGQLVLITGGTGFVGSEIALEALRQGFNIRLAVRKASQAEAFKTAYPEFATRVSFVIVPDLQADGAYDEGVKEADYVVHAASPATFTPEVSSDRYGSDVEADPSRYMDRTIVVIS